MPYNLWMGCGVLVSSFLKDYGAQGHVGQREDNSAKGLARIHSLRPGTKAAGNPKESRVLYALGQSQHLLP